MTTTEVSGWVPSRFHMLIGTIINTIALVGAIGAFLVVGLPGLQPKPE